MATLKFNSKSPTIRRILKEAAEISSSPSPDYTATPLETDLFEWHFTLRGPPRSAFAEGIYHGRIVLPPTYPLRPPMFRFSTPSGRFEANREICLSISGHHEETWQPAWGVRTALVALRSFMETDAQGQIGGLNSAEPVRRRLAAESRGWTCSACGKSNEDILREVEEECQRLDAEEQGEKEKKRREEIEIPAELRMGFRDEMMEKTQAPEGNGTAGSAAGPATTTTTTTTSTAEEDNDTAHLAEGFVQTAPYPPARPGQGVPQPTRTIPLPVPQAAAPVTAQWPAANHHHHHAAANADVPVWIDYAIMVLVGLLIAMLLKILTGY
ncbi:ubiquitin-conjugating enzyme/RWD-like protein [Apiospora arundinis]|uniref:Ubiquitin-conjugating enzyme/RWD-like protein n=1 Tax=Apiospora arundinis TaxID=335852 RepID=A0ABR2I3C3_9PEZI